MGQAPPPLEVDKNVAINTAASYASHQIGQAYGKADKPLSYGEHKLLHGAVGGAAGWLINPTTQGLVAGAGGAIAAEMMAGEIIKPEEIARQVREEAQNQGIPLTQETFIQQVQDKLQTQIDRLRIGVGAVACATGQDVGTALITSGIALENNSAAVAAAQVARYLWQMAAAASGVGAGILVKEKLDKEDKTTQTQRDTGSAKAGANATPPDGWEPDDHKQRGVRVDNKTLWRDSKKNRLDVENPAPGKRPGQIHYQDAKGNKYIYDHVIGKFKNAPNKINDMIDTNPEFKAALEKALSKYLGI